MSLETPVVFDATQFNEASRLLGAKVKQQDFGTATSLTVAEFECIYENYKGKILITAT